jgi:hypothetical protein
MKPMLLFRYAEVVRKGQVVSLRYKLQCRLCTHIVIESRNEEHALREHGHYHQCRGEARAQPGATRFFLTAIGEEYAAQLEASGAFRHDQALVVSTAGPENPDVEDVEDDPTDF